MSSLFEKQSYVDWQSYGYTLKTIPPTWDNEYEFFDWKETFMIDEIPSNDVWNIPSTATKYQLEDMYRSLGINKEATKHYMALNPKLDEGLNAILSHFPYNKLHYNFLKLTPGNNIMWHFDTYATFIKHNDVTDDELKNIKRTGVLLSPWNFGQIIQVGNQILHNWKVGDCCTWTSDQWHGASNFGFSDLVIMQITYVDDSQS